MDYPNKQTIQSLIFACQHQFWWPFKSELIPKEVVYHSVSLFWSAPIWITFSFAGAWTYIRLLLAHNPTKVPPSITLVNPHWTVWVPLKPSLPTWLSIPDRLPQGLHHTLPASVREIHSNCKRGLLEFWLLWSMIGLLTNVTPHQKLASHNRSSLDDALKA